MHMGGVGSRRAHTNGLFRTRTYGHECGVDMLTNGGLGELHERRQQGLRATQTPQANAAL